MSRALNHFYNPQNNITILGNIANHLSPNWALEDFDLIVSVPGVGQQNFSYHDAQVDFYYSFTAQSNSTRKLYLGRALQKLGHVVHHVQDMAQPQHTRLYPHIDAPAIAQFYPENDSDLSVYEVFTEDLRECGAININQPAGGGYRTCNADDLEDWKYDWQSPIFNLTGYPDVYAISPREFWHTTNNKGLADFSSRNFITTDTAYSYSGCTASSCPFDISKLGSHGLDLPMPSGSSTTTAIKTVALSQLNGTIRFGKW